MLVWFMTECCDDGIIRLHKDFRISQRWLLGMIGEAMNFLRSDQTSAPYKSTDIVKFEQFMNNANSHLARDDKANAKLLYMDALNLKQIPLINAAEPMNGVAKILIDEDRFDAAEPLAFIAARLRSRDPDYVNTYATILIEKCRLPEALDILKGLELDQDFE